MLRRSVILALAALLASPAAVAQQFPRDSFAPQSERGQGEREVSLGQIQRQLRSQYGGELVDARRRGDRYEITWIAGDGRRMVIEVDARTGRTISVRG